MTVQVQTYANGVTRGRALSLIVHSDTKVGKSTLANTAPAPRLLIDAEMAYRFVPGVKVFWNPLLGPPPTPDGTWETCVVIIREYNDLVMVMQYLAAGMHLFKSIIVDSVTEIQVKCKQQLTTGNYDMDQRKWGALLDHMAQVCRDLRDLTEHPTMPLECVVLTAMTEYRNNKWRPYVQGKLAVNMPYFMDVIGYLFISEVPSEDPTAPPRKVRKMLTQPHPQIEAGERVQGRLAEYVENPTIPEMLTAIFGQEQSN